MRVLIADDCPVTRLRLKKHVSEWGFQPVTASDGQQALAALTAKFAPRLAILDWMMPIIDGPTVARYLRKEDLGPYAYIIMLTAKSNAENLVSGFAAGIDDYLTKPFDEQELRQRLRAGQRILNLHDQLNQTMEQLKFQATHDTLTGLLNRRAILDSLQRELNRAGRNLRNPEPTGVVLLDINQFKSINETHGHFAGDNVLKAFGDIMRKSLRSYDFVGRYGGKKFVIVLPAADRDEVEEIVQRIRKNIQQTSIDIGGSSRIHVSASMGMVMAEPCSTSESLIRKADRALFFAKQNSGNQAVFYDQLPNGGSVIDVPQTNIEWPATSTFPNNR